MRTGSTILYINQYYEKVIAGTGVGTVTTYYYHGGRLVAEQTGTHGNYTLTYIHQDHLSGTSLLTDASGAQTGGTMKYKPFGETISGAVLSVTVQTSLPNLPTISVFLETTAPGRTRGVGGIGCGAGIGQYHHCLGHHCNPLQAAVVSAPRPHIRGRTHAMCCRSLEHCTEWTVVWVKDRFSLSDCVPR